MKIIMMGVSLQGEMSGETMGPAGLKESWSPILVDSRQTCRRNWRPTPKDGLCPPPTLQLRQGHIFQKASHPKRRYGRLGVLFGLAQGPNLRRCNSLRFTQIGFPPKTRGKWKSRIWTTAVTLSVGNHQGQHHLPGGLEQRTGHSAHGSAGPPRGDESQSVGYG